MGMFNSMAYSYRMVGDLVPTPMIRLHDDVFVKCEFLHPGRSHKARVACALIDDTEAQHGPSVRHERVLLERTGGNLGVALALESRSRGYRLTLVTDPQASLVKMRIATKLGATVIDRGVAYPRAQSNGDVIRILLNEDSRYFYLNQFANPANPRAHETGTGPEIVADLRARGHPPETTVVLVTGMGTGASMRGISAALRKYFPRVVTVAVQPPNCDLLAARYGEHEAYGIAVGEPAPFMAISEVDGVVAVSSSEIVAAHDRILREHRFLVGTSSAANLAALSAARSHPACQGEPRVFVTLLFDRGEDYL